MSKFRRNIWMYGIICAILLFMTTMVSFAILASHHPVDLVIDDYYKAEVAYQGQINKMKNLDSLGEKPQIEYVPDAGSVMIQMPDKLTDQVIAGDVNFYRPNTSAKDFHTKLLLNATGRQLVNASAMQKGRWKIQLDWTADGTEYYYEKEFDIK